MGRLTTCLGEVIASQLRPENLLDRILRFVGNGSFTSVDPGAMRYSLGRSV